MKDLTYIKCFEDFKQKNITVEDIIKCINSDGFLETDIIKDYADKIKGPEGYTVTAGPADATGPFRPISVDDDGEITIEIDSKTYLVDLDDVKKIIY